MAAKSKLTLEEKRDRVVEAAMPLVSMDGWSNEALRAAAQDAGFSRADLHDLFPGGVLDALAHFADRADRAMIEGLSAMDLDDMRVRDRVIEGVMARINFNQPYRQAVRQAVAYLSLPPRSLTSSKIIWRSADRIWQVAGDTATDYNHYTKRAILAGIYSATLAVFVNDESEGKADTHAFLYRRIDGVMKFEKAKAQLLGRDRELPSLTRFLGRLRYPAR